MFRNIILVFAFASILFANQIDIVDKNFERSLDGESGKLLSYSKILKDVKNSVVNISTLKNINSNGSIMNPLLNDPFFRQFFGKNFNIPQEKVERALGSGVIITDDGYIVTNDHVVSNSDKVLVSIAGDTKEYVAKIVGSDPKSDLAVIKIDGKKFNKVKLYDSDKVEVGDVVFAIGNPFGVGGTITSGIVSGINRSAVGINEYENFIQTDAPINPGNSGGALVNSLGYLIGINSAILTKSGGNNGIGFSIPSNMVYQIASSIIKNGKFERAWLGVSIADISDNVSKFYDGKEGALVMDVTDDSPAFKAGIKRGDLIVQIDNKKITGPSMLKNIVGSYAPATKVKITYIRDKVSSDVIVELGNLNAPHSSKVGYIYKGLTLEPLTDKIKKDLRLNSDVYGVYVSAVDVNSVSYEVGFRSNDIIIQIESKDIESIDDFKSSTKDTNEKRFFIYREGEIFVAVL